MREVLNINQNFITGEVTEEIKVKDNDETKGIVTIELGTGEKIVEQTISNNYIKSLGIKKLPWKVSRDYRAGLNKGDSVDYFFPFGNIVLTDYTGEEDINDYFVRGDVVGWSPRTDVSPGSNIKRGKYNVDESYTTITDDGYMHYHYVYDFSEAQGNGTIGSVYWIPEGPGTLSATEIITYPFIKMHEITVPSTLPVEGRDTNITIPSTRNFDHLLRPTVYYKHASDNIDLYRHLEGGDYFVNGISTSRLKITSKVPKCSVWYCISPTEKWNYDREVVGGALESRVGKLSLHYYPNLASDVRETSEIDFAKLPTVKKYLDLYIGTSTSYGKVYPSVGGVDNEGNVYIFVDIFPESATKRLPQVNADGTLVQGVHARWVYMCIYNVKTKSWVLPLNLEDYRCYYNYGGFSISTSTSTVTNFTGRAWANTYNGAGVLYITGGVSKMFRTEGCIPKIIDDFKFNGMSASYYMTNGREIPMMAYDNGTNKGFTYWEFMGMIGAHTKLPKPIEKTSDVPMKVKYDIYIQLANRFYTGDNPYEFNNEW